MTQKKKTNNNLTQNKRKNWKKSKSKNGVRNGNNSNNCFTQVPQQWCTTTTLIPPSPLKRPQYPRVTPPPPKSPPSLNESIARFFAHCVKSKQNSSQKSIARHDISNCNNLCFCEKKISSNRSASRALSLKRTVTKIKQKRKKKN